MNPGTASDSPYTAAEVAALARRAGLTVPPERLPALATELDLARRVVDSLLPVAEGDVAAVAAAFDPAWPEPKGRAR